MTNWAQAFAGLRVADVRDGMDFAGYLGYGSMSPSIRPLFPARMVGVARTVRYLPYLGPVTPTTAEAHRDWSNWYYGNVCTYPWVAEIQPGEVAVIDQSGVDAGLMGSNNTLEAVRKGVEGFVSSGGVRDTDEIELQRIPFWSAMRSQSRVQGKLQFDATQVAVAVGGVTVRPGDIVVADSDGVIVVPVEAAEAVLRWARHEKDADVLGRRAHYEALGRALDETVQP